ncbi:S-isoprenylcysteine O-methyltransferase [Quillaja saponaria]|uniref:S-isoprenylcysteine O-methyltransferase n=1 Tax=Quillaja saponaria TaxID=32244 RepID=A0AAD7PAE6_QUISA|nr:S-isoprenylcysteine O-methyltransferase [Quillaja saponaria]
MEATSVLCHSKAVPVGNTLSVYGRKVSLRHFNKHLGAYTLSNTYQCRLKPNNIRVPLNCSFNSNPFSPPPKPTRKRNNLLLSPKCSVSNNTSPESLNPLLKPLKNLSFDSIKAILLQLTPIGIVKWSGVLAIAIASTKWTVNLLFNPFFWMYFSWTWLFWPWFVAIALAFYGLYCFRKHLLGEASIFEQLSIVTSVFTWLTLVPPAHFNGYLEGWPFVFFFVYHYFFFFNVSVRKRLYGDYYARPHDPKWDVNPPMWRRLLFSLGVMVGHWLAAFEGPELHLIPGGWNHLGVWILITVTLLMQYNSTLYLAKYSEKVVVPTAVVQFGPYRWVRHPIYSSTMLLFGTYSLALRAPLSFLFILAVCLLYYEHKARLEEALMVETFGDSYTEYASKVSLQLSQEAWLVGPDHPNCNAGFLENSCSLGILS